MRQKTTDDPFQARKIEQAVNGALADYLAKGRHIDLEEVDEETCGSLLKVFLDACHREVRVPPEEIEDEALREVLLHWMPKRINPRRAGAEKAVRVVRDFYEYDQGGGDRKLTAARSELFSEAEQKFPQMLREGTTEKAGGVEPLKSEPVKAGRNDPCPCGSGKKFKKCCGRG